MDVEEVVNVQVVCRFTMAVNRVLLNKIYRLGVMNEDAEPAADETELALKNYLMKVYQSVMST